MRDLVLNDFPDDLYRRLIDQAEKNGRSVSDEALIVLTQELRFTSLDENLKNIEDRPNETRNPGDYGAS